MSAIYHRTVGPGLVEVKVGIPGEQVCVEHGGILLTLNIMDEGIEIRWADDRSLASRVAMVPTSHNTLLFPKLRNVTKVKTVVPKEEAQPAPAGRIRRTRSGA
jgi:hypothetical protein